ncbi:MAG: carboxypeptidase regulatory-like domain-containing protein [Patescibacteria group bacterium]|nr:carboxypeptidase regulatory-like domain-containing protein [Patescibacteria group bacterium]
MQASRRTYPGMTLIEVVVASAILLVAFIGLYSLFQASLHYLAIARAREGALSLAVERMEELRALPYSSVGTVSGIPSGTIPQDESVALDGISYDRRTLIQYVDDPADSSGSADADGPEDYKRAKVVVSFSTSYGTSSVDLISNFIGPGGSETNNGGGTLSLTAINAEAQPISGAEVNVVNTSLNPTINVTTYANTSGLVLFPGAPPGSGYQITVTYPGYSTAQTYAATSQNPNPNPGNLTVSANQTTSATFAIDALASLLVRTWQPIESATTTDTLTSSSYLSATSNTGISGGALTLTSGQSGYPPSGSAQSTTFTPSYLSQWQNLSWSATAPAGTSVTVQLFEQNGTLIPNSALPGNSTGFTTSPINISALSTSTYPSLIIGATLATNNASTTPSISSWSLSYLQGPIPLPSITFSIHGAKTIGTSGLGAAIYKVSQTLSTNTSGEYSTSTLEWDSYTTAVASTTNWDVSSACPSEPFSVAPGSSGTNNLYLVAHTQNSLAVAVHSQATGNPIANATTTLSRSGFSSTVLTDSCGNAFFPGLTAASNYGLSVSALGYTGTTTAATISVSGQSTYSISL